MCIFLYSSLFSLYNNNDDDFDSDPQILAATLAWLGRDVTSALHNHRSAPGDWTDVEL